jgi:hypothetical protein
MFPSSSDAETIYTSGITDGINNGYSDNVWFSVGSAPEYEVLISENIHLVAYIDFIMA